MGDKDKIRDNLEMETIIKNQIERVNISQNFDEFKWHVKKLHVLLFYYKDKKFKTDKQIEKYMEKLEIEKPRMKMCREDYKEFQTLKIYKKEQYRYELIYRELIGLCKRLGISLETERKDILE